MKRRQDRHTLSDMTERGTIRVGGERLSNHSSSVPPQEAVCLVAVMLSNVMLSNNYLESLRLKV